VPRLQGERTIIVLERKFMLAKHGLDNSQHIEYIESTALRRDNLLANFFGFDVLPSPVCRNSLVEGRL
jgi:hypothetical protein